MFGDSQFTSTLSVNFPLPKIPRRTLFLRMKQAAHGGRRSVPGSGLIAARGCPRSVPGREPRGVFVGIEGRTAADLKKLVVADRLAVWMATPLFHQAGPEDDGHPPRRCGPCQTMHRRAPTGRFHRSGRPVTSISGGIGALVVVAGGTPSSTLVRINSLFAHFTGQLCGWRPAVAVPWAGSVLPAPRPARIPAVRWLWPL